MAFVIVENQQIKGSQVEWKFEGLDTIYKSNPEQFERNVKFWRAKLGIGPAVKHVILNGNLVEDAKFEIVNDGSTTDNSTVESTSNESDAESDMVDPTKVGNNTARRKRRPKTT